MTSFTELPPTPDLSPFIRCYSIGPIHKKGLYAIKPIQALHEVCLVFILNKIPPATASMARPYYICGISTTCEGNVFFNEPCTVFYIHFKPNGFYKIFNRCPKDFLNKTADAIEVLGLPLQQAGDALQTCCTYDDMAMISNRYLLQCLAQQTSGALFDNITAASTIILNNVNITTAQLALYVNMSLRNFERRFQQQVGISAKHYCRLVRFTNALMLKVNAIQKDWTSIAQACGYFDQMHLIKDFYQFTGCSPSGFFKRWVMMEHSSNLSSLQ